MKNLTIFTGFNYSEPVEIRVRILPPVRHYKRFLGLWKLKMWKYVIDVEFVSGINLMHSTVPAIENMDSASTDKLELIREHICEFTNSEIKHELMSKYPSLTII